MLRHRLISALVMAAAFLGVICLDQALSPRLPVVTTLADLGMGLATCLLVAAIVALGAVEFCHLAKASGHRVLFKTTLVLAVLMSLLPLAPLAWPTLAEGPLYLMGLALCIPTAFICKLWLRESDGATDQIAISLMGVVYLGGLACFAQLIRIEHDALTLTACLLIIKSCDIGAYFAGRHAGKHKLIPWLSPNKTWEGLAGGALTCALVGAAVGPALALYGGVTPSWTWPIGLGLGLAIGLVGQVGDLMESMLKRDAHQKDSGTTVPGFGGVLDVIDSPLLGLPAAWLALRCLA